MHTILVPVDGSLHALKALRIACDLAEKYGGSIVLLHVLSEGRDAEELLNLAVASTFGPKLSSMLQKAAGKLSGPVPQNVLRAVGKKILDQAADKVRRLGLEVEILDMGLGDPADNVLMAYKRTGANTIVMGSRGVTSSDASSFGSVSQKVFEQAACTCLSVK